LPLLAFRPVGASVGPFLDQGPIEPLDLAVGLGPVGASALVFDSLAGEQVPSAMGLVAGPVVGQYPLHRDPDRAEVGVGTLPEAGGWSLSSRWPIARCRPDGSGRPQRCGCRPIRLWRGSCDPGIVPALGVLLRQGCCRAC